MLREDQRLTVSDVVLSRVDSADERQSEVVVTECEQFGDGQTPRTFSHALINARNITFDCSGTLPVPEIVIVKDVVINAPQGVVLQAAHRNRVMRVMPGIEVSVTGLDITGGRFSDGSGLFNLGNISLSESEITGNNGSTAVVLNAGVLALKGVRLFRNIINYDSVFKNSGVITGTDVSIESHVASAGAVITNEGRIELTQCLIDGLGTNNVYSISNLPGSTFKLFNCNITDSGSLFFNEGTLEIFDSSIDRNRGDQTLIESAGVLKIGGTGVTENEVSGLIIYNDGLAEILNSTISGNRAGFSVFGNADNSDDFVGVVSNEGLMRVSSSTIANNIHPGFTERQLGNAGELELTNSIIVGGENGVACGGVGLVTSLGHNLYTDGTCGVAQQSDNPFGNPGLQRLANNGGAGKTHALLPDSDALDAGNCNNGTLSKDQRGVTRAQGPACDIGAFELEVSSTSTPETDNGETDNDNNQETETDTGEDANNGEEEANTGGDTDTGDNGTDTESPDSVDDTVNEQTTDAADTPETSGVAEDGNTTGGADAQSGGGVISGCQILMLLAILLVSGWRRLVFRR